MIPTFDQLLRPILELAAEGDVSRRQATPGMVRKFGLIPAEAEQRLPSGASTVIGNRSGWAMTFLTKAGLIEKVARGVYRATPTGRAYLVFHPERITVADLKQLPGWEDAWESGKRRREERRQADAPADDEEAGEILSTATPEEAIEAGMRSLESDLRARLLAAILAQPPDFFERLVLRVLRAMGYGSSGEDAFRHVGQSGDEGIDGRISQDALGLDQVCVQAKRYAPDRPIDRMAIQAFIGSLAGHGVTKGIFITTSSFKGTAEEFVTRGSSTKVVLVDGQKLIDLMLEHEIGVRVKQTHRVLEVDQNFFAEE